MAIVTKKIIDISNLNNIHAHPGKYVLKIEGPREDLDHFINFPVIYDYMSNTNDFYYRVERILNDLKVWHPFEKIYIDSLFESLISDSKNISLFDTTFSPEKYIPPPPGVILLDYYSIYTYLSSKKDLMEIFLRQTNIALDIDHSSNTFYSRVLQWRNDTYGSASPIVEISYSNKINKKLERINLVDNKISLITSLSTFAMPVKFFLSMSKMFANLKFDFSPLIANNVQPPTLYFFSFKNGQGVLEKCG
jgi:hypothetical protein